MAIQRKHEVPSGQEVQEGGVSERLGHVAVKPAVQKPKLDDDLDSLLDEIDKVLEENAEEFVKSYIQKGGQ